VVAIDIGGPRPPGARAPHPYADLAPLVLRARDAGLGVTFHVGEEGVNAPDRGPFVDEMHAVIDLGVDRIGHGIIAGLDRGLRDELRRRDVTLEICPTSNLRTGAVRDIGQLARIVRALADDGVPLVVATDGPEMIGTRLRDEHRLLVDCGALSAEEARAADARAHARSFVTPARGA
jgi:adenosine deaminase